MKKIVLCFLLSFGAAAATISTVRFAAADTGSGSATVATTPDAGSAAVATPAPATAAPAPAVLTPQVEDISVLTKLWKNGAFFSLGIIAVYLGLVAWSKVDKKHAFYAATGAAGLVVLVEAIRKGDAPTMTAVMSTLTTTVGVLVAGPGHVPAGK